MDLGEEYVEAFKKLFKDAKKDQDGKLGQESLMDAIVEMLKQQAADEEQEKQREQQTALRGPLSARDFNLGDKDKKVKEQVERVHGAMDDSDVSKVR